MISAALMNLEILQKLCMARFTVSVMRSGHQEAIEAFLDETDEMFVCVLMLAYEALGYSQYDRIKKTDSNKIAEIMHGMKAWETAGIRHFKKYSRQRTWKRKNAPTAPADGFMDIPEQMELSFDK